MDSRSLETFAEVVRRGSFAAVARDRGVSSSSVSRAIAGLERQLGVRLFQRTTRRLAATEAANVLFEEIEPVLGELEDACARAADVAARPRGTLRIAAPVSYSLRNVVPSLALFADRYPELDIDLNLTDANIDLVAERIDVAIRLGPLRDSTLVARRLATMVTRTCASPAYLEEHGRPHEPSELDRHSCLVLDMPGFTGRWRFRDPAGAETAVDVKARLRTSNALALRRCALDGMGVVMQAEWMVSEDLASGDLIDLFPDYEASAASFDAPAMWVVYPSKAYLPLKVRVFIDFLVEMMGARKPRRARRTGNLRS